ncbi:MAG: hypothetical protein RL272_950, partial [Candidatus Parcubacteria bacterium]
MVRQIFATLSCFLPLFLILLSGQNIPKTVKKISITLLVWAFKGLIGLKKCLTLLLLMVKRPFFWLCRAVINPVFAVFYLLYRFIRKALSAVTEPMRNRAMSLLANRYAIHAVVIILTFVVTATNLYASNGASAQVDSAGQKSILADLTRDDSEAVVVEEAQTQNINASPDVSYLSNQALAAHDGSAVDDNQQGTDEGAYQDDPEELVLSSPLANAVRVEPQVDQDSAPPTRTRVEEY